jgi:hypothetical protein
LKTIDSNMAITIPFTLHPFTLAQGWQKCVILTNNLGMARSVQQYWQGFKQEGLRKVLGNEPTIFLNAEVSSREIDDSHSEVEGRRNLPKGNLVQNLAQKRNPIKEPSHIGFEGGYKITSRCIAFGSPVANSYAQSNNITSK